MAWSCDPARPQWTLAVNVSAYQFKHPDFVDVVRSVLTETRANAQLLELELTESQLVEDVSGVIAKMDSLRALGVRLSLDDFGTGYSSLAMLKRLPLHQLKIGQPYVAGASVKGEVVEGVVKGEKVFIQKFGPKKAWKKKTGHRQRYTKVKVTAING